MPTYTQCMTDNSTVLVTQPYGHNGHGGMDFVMQGTHHIYAPFAGTITTAHHWQGGTTGNDSWGNYIVVRFAPNQYYLIAHMVSQLHTVGETLTQGQYVGEMGKTGNTHGVYDPRHVHLEYWNGGEGTNYRANPSVICGWPNSDGFYNVVWGAPSPPAPGPGPGPGPDPGPGPGPKPVYRGKHKRCPICCGGIFFIISHKRSD